MGYDPEWGHHWLDPAKAARLRSERDELLAMLQEIIADTQQEKSYDEIERIPPSLGVLEKAESLIAQLTRDPKSKPREE